MIRWWVALLWAATVAHAQIDVPDVDAPAEGELVAEHKSVAAGGSIRVGVRITMKPTWHVYWMNPGDSGMPVDVTWMLPKGVTASPLEWPAPHRIPAEPLMTYGYDDELLLAVRLQVPKDWKPKTLKVSARASWLVCADVCMEGGMAREIEIPVQSVAERKKTDSAASFARARSTLPRAAPKGALEASAAGIKIDLKKLPVHEKALVYFFPRKAGWLDHAAAQVLARGEDHALLSLTRAGPDSDKAKNRNVRGVLVIGEGKARRAFAVDLPVIQTQK